MLYDDLTRITDYIRKLFLSERRSGMNMLALLLYNYKVILIEEISLK